VSADVLCLRPAADFAEVGVDVPADLRICFASSPDEVPAADLATARAVVLAAVGPRLDRAWLDRVTRLQLLQFTGAGVDRVGDSCAHRPEVAVANVPAANVREVAEYVLFAAGSLLRLPMLRELSVGGIATFLSRHAVRLFSAVAEGGRPICSMDFTGPAAVAVGSEGAGLPKELAAAGEQFTIPLVPTAESLNVAAATAVALYEIARQRAGSHRGTETQR